MEITQSTQPLSGTTGLKIEKYAPSVADMFAAGKFKVSSTKMVGSKDKKALDKFLKLVNSGQNREAVNLTFLGDDGKVYTFGQIRKPKVTANMGDTAEGVFAAAIFCRFTNRNTDVKVTDVFKVLNGIRKTETVKGGAKVEKNVKADNEGISLKDDVKLYISLAKANLNFLIDKKSKAALNGYAQSSVAYANNINVKKWAKIIYENRRYDQIEIISDGVGSLPGMGQTTTKVDTFVTITDDKGKPQDVDIKVSLKVDDVKQFGQKGGVNFDRQKNAQGKMVDGYVELFDKLFGINIKSKKNVYNRKLHKEKDTSGAINYIYDHVASELTSRMRTKRQRADVFKNLGDAIDDFATLGEEHVTLVQLAKGEAKIYNFRGLNNVLAEYDFDVDYVKGINKTTGEPLPSVIIVEKTSRAQLLIVRVKRESVGGGYYRNLIEKGKFMGDLIAEYA